MTFQSIFDDGPTVPGGREGPENPRGPRFPGGPCGPRLALLFLMLPLKNKSVTICKHNSYLAL